MPLIIFNGVEGYLTLFPFAEFIHPPASAVSRMHQLDGRSLYCYIAPSPIVILGTVKEDNLAKYYHQLQFMDCPCCPEIVYLVYLKENVRLAKILELAAWPFISRNFARRALEKLAESRPGIKGLPMPVIESLLQATRLPEDCEHELGLMFMESHIDPDKVRIIKEMYLKHLAEKRGS